MIHINNSQNIVHEKWTLEALFDGDTFSVEEDVEDDREEIKEVLDTTLPRKWVVAEDYALQKMKNGNWKWICRYTEEHFVLSSSSTLDTLVALGSPVYQKSQKPRSLKYDKPSTWEDRVNRAIVNGMEFKDIYSYTIPKPMFERYMETRPILPNRWEIW